MNSNQTLITHLLELRTRITHSLIALVLVFLCLMPWASDLYTLLAQPLLSRLPLGTQMIATDVTTPFFVPVKVALIVVLAAIPGQLDDLLFFAVLGAVRKRQARRVLS